MIGPRTGLGDRLDRLEVAVGRDREAGLDHVDPEARELLGDLELLGDVERDAGRLLAVSQCRVEDQHPVHRGSSRGFGGVAGVFGQTKTLPARRHERVRRVPLGTRRYVRSRLWLRSTSDIGSGIIPQPDPEVNEFRRVGCETAPVSRLLRRGVVVGAVAGVAYAAWRFVASRAAASDGPGYEPQPFPMPPLPVARADRGCTRRSPAPTGGRGDGAVDPEPDGNCPIAYPIKGKLSTGIYHPPVRSRTTGPRGSLLPRRVGRARPTDCAPPSAERVTSLSIVDAADLLSRDHDRRRRCTCSRISRSSS